ncbi:hypothetical protein HW561_16190 [Rhodobacteraceae bacterium B1Z28]|uniref:Uncharacterized protein n=1 Tax=Ruegeria haliotis TaxID=2747601 RepID=A0ABX2PUG7_9RHOB|nr:hypothetical protein [Ruegeria haliotis]NVO57335.1 hypothetical protein [Ruegeria haliotis]
MQLPIFIAGLFLSIILSAVIGILAGFETPQLILFVVAITIALQLAFVLIIALLAIERKRKMRASEDETPTAPSARASQETDV